MVHAYVVVIRRIVCRVEVHEGGLAGEVEIVVLAPSCKVLEAGFANDAGHVGQVSTAVSLNLVGFDLPGPREDCPWRNEVVAVYSRFEVVTARLGTVDATEFDSC
jgi:hypothetical protein